MIKDVKFKSVAWDISASIHYPKNFDESKKYPAVVCAHPIGSCKEQTAGNVYAAALSEAGFVAVAFDAGFQGESSGEPRRLEEPSLRVLDFKYVCDYVSGLEFVDKDKIGVLGMCGGGGYTINAAMSEKRFRAVVTVAGVNFGRAYREIFSGYNPNAVLEDMARQRNDELQGKAVKIVPFIATSVEAAKESGAGIDVTEATDYYINRDPKPNGLVTAIYSLGSGALAWDAFHLAEVLLTQPLMAVVGDMVGEFGSYRDGCEIIGRAASKEKELVVIKGHSHYDLYDNTSATSKALEKIVPFFKKHLA